jgi:uncharacterized integral membrane protein
MTDDHERQDVEGEFESLPLAEPSAGLPWGGIVATLGLILVVVFAVQNTETVSIEFLWMAGDFPLSIVILVTAVASALFAALGGAFYRRRRRLRRAEKHELRQLRSED